MEGSKICNITIKKVSRTWLRSDISSMPFCKINVITFWPHLCPARFLAAWQNLPSTFSLHLRLRPAGAKS